MILSNGHPFGDLKRIAVHNQNYEMAAYIRDVERDIINNIKYGQKIPNKYFKSLNDRLIVVDGYRHYKSWLRKIKIKSIYGTKR